MNNLERFCIFALIGLALGIVWIRFSDPIGPPACACEACKKKK